MLILTILGAFLWRLRGGLLNNITGKANYLGLNDTAVRAIWSVGMAVAVCLLHPPSYWIGQPIWIEFILLFIAFFSCAVVGWFGAALLPVKIKDVALLSLSGLVRMLALAILFLSPWPLVAGLLFGPAYWIGAKIPQSEHWEFWGEFLAGGIVGLFLSFS